MKKLQLGGWFWFFSDEESKLEKDKCGKWMHFFKEDAQDFAISICEKAIEEGACCECKCTDYEFMKNHNTNNHYDSGVICFYLNGDDKENHKRVIDFMLKYDLIRKTKTGRLYNDSFKFDSQTRAHEYGADFQGKLKLEQFIDLNTGKWLG